MISVHVKASREYDVIIGSGLLAQVGDYARKLHPASATTAAIISDSIVAKLYGSLVENSLKQAGFRVVSYTFEQGENSKNLTVFGDILEFLAEHSLSRSDFVVALGGGVTGDMAGFASACYQRGIRFIQIPTTLLAAVDSSVGGKTAVNLRAGKNLAGAFAQPELVLCDPDTLSTLPEDIFHEGTAEVIKYAMLSDPELFELLQEDIRHNPELIIARCVKHKADLVLQDEFDTGMRQLLNFGHTIGHAIELNSSYGISHGAAVAAGMAIMTRACVKKGLCAESCAKQLEQLLQKHCLPTTCEFTAEQLHQGALHDKKHSGGALTIIILRSIGHCELMKISDNELLEFIRLGL